MTALIIAIYAAAVATLALMIAVGTSFKATRTEDELTGIADHLWPRSSDLAADLRREDLRQ